MKGTCFDCGQTTELVQHVGGSVYRCVVCRDAARRREYERAAERQRARSGNRCGKCGARGHVGVECPWG